MNPATRDPGHDAEDPGILRRPKTSTPMIPGKARTLNVPPKSQEHSQGFKNTGPRSRPAAAK
ncbi:hypothetical protein NDU88_001059, partial [Pleurodeles waltl]